MSYEVLARKLRPAGFDELVGQDHVVRALKHGLDNDRLHHAYLFTGTRGVGKTTIARILAKALNCEQGISSTPCETCSVCTQVKENRFVDLIEVDAASRTGVDDTRDLLENAQYLPTVGRYKVYLIDEVHMLSIQAFNALLKTLEEPPEHVKFLLATTDPKKVPVTVLSRCLQFQLKNLSRETIAAYLTDVLGPEGIEYEPGAIEVISDAAAGSMRDALSLTDQAIGYGQGQLKEADVTAMLGIVGRSAVDEVLAQIAAGDTQRLMSISAELAESNADFEDLLRKLAERLHQLAVANALNDIPSGSPDFSAEEVQLYYQLVLLGQRDINLAPEPRSGFEMTLLRMLAFAPGAESRVPARAGADTVKKSLAETPADTAPAADAGASAVEHAADEIKAEPQEPEGQQPEGQQPELKAEVVTDPAAQVGAGLARWYELVTQLQIGGVTKMVADNCILLELDLPRCKLVLDARHETLLSDAQQKQLQRALSETLEQQVELSIEVAEVQAETPARRNERLAQERQQAAEREIAQDPNVASLLSDFGASVVEVRPN